MTDNLTGRYQLRPTLFGGLRVYVECYAYRGFVWRRARVSDLPALETVVDVTGKRYRE